ncbi:MAG: transcriptional regulator, BadM/Rrf2 family [Pseudonocardiales bacterium]|jgi:Rrf2 family protein|nr:transcriptional regulator, BadM/Rrf2 family [Jatrophihabitantaceae bacterium]MCW2604811.1 transcriptional regulator, BadM/Rrf2 family [Pseudonocardiales bacterium]
MQISARSDYALRAMLVLADRVPEWVSVTDLAQNQQLPRPFLEQILGELRRARLVRSQRGARGGYTIEGTADSISLGSIIRVVEGTLTEVRGRLPGDLAYTGPAALLPQIMLAVDASVRSVLDDTTLADVINGTLPAHVQSLLAAG